MKHSRALAVLTVLIFVGAVAVVFAYYEPVARVGSHESPAKFARKDPGPISPGGDPPEPKWRGESSSAALSDGAMKSGTLAGIQAGGAFGASSPHEIAQRSIRATIRKLG